MNNSRLTKKLKIFFLLFLMFILSNKAYSAGYNTPHQTESNEEILFIVDFSSSMNNTMQGRTLINHALDAVKNILLTSDSSSKIGLRIFGYTENPEMVLTPRGYKYNFDKLCEATTIVFPPAKYNSVYILDKLQKLKPWGVTPIEYSLRQAVMNDFSNDDSIMKHIILVTDGAENCHGDPCGYVSEIMRMRKDFKVDVIGISINNKDYKQLSCIAQAGSGGFYSIDEPEDFTSKFREAVNSSQNYLKNSSNTGISYGRNSSGKIEYKTYTFLFDY